MNLKPEELVKALRCTSTPGKPTGDCEMCPYYRRENLNDELKEKLGTDTWTSCDVDKVGMDAADQIERDQKEIAELREELENLKKPLDVEIFDEEGREYIDYVCPKCKETITQARKDARTVILAVRKYHEDCGQPLRWPMAGTKYGTRYRGMPEPLKEDV